MIVAIVPARGGSRALPRKNLRRIGGRSLVELAVVVARASPSVDRVIVSTDDDAIAREAEHAGAEVPFRRPAELAGDEAPTIDVLRHACSALEAAGATIDIVVTLQPTTPHRTAELVETAISAVRDGGADSAVTVEDLGAPWSTVGYVDDGTFHRSAFAGADERRQASPPAARLTGAVYVTRRTLIEEGLVIGPRCAAVATGGASTIDIDSLADLVRARRAGASGST